MLYRQSHVEAGSVNYSASQYANACLWHISNNTHAHAHDDHDLQMRYLQKEARKKP
jgi:hypothetical protein